MLKIKPPSKTFKGCLLQEHSNSKINRFCLLCCTKFECMEFCKWQVFLNIKVYFDFHVVQLIHVPFHQNREYCNIYFSIPERKKKSVEATFSIALISRNTAETYTLYWRMFKLIIALTWLSNLIIGPVLEFLSWLVSSNGEIEP